MKLVRSILLICFLAGSLQANKPSTAEQKTHVLPGALRSALATKTPA